jgi:DNA-binding GntR family transcriptional regulator
MDGVEELNVAEARARVRWDGARTRARATKDAGTDTLLAALRRDLAHGAYHPRERLIEAELVHRYNSTRAAVRDALLQLATEGLIERAPNRGARVRPMSLQEAIEIIEIRRSLECFCAGRAARLASTAERNHLRTLAESLRHSADTDSNAYLVINSRFHATVYTLARHATAQAILEHFADRPIDLFFPEPYRAMPMEDWADAHYRIATAIAAGDAETAESTMYAHLTRVLDGLKRMQSETARSHAAF